MDGQVKLVAEPLTLAMTCQPSVPPLHLLEAAEWGPWPWSAGAALDLSVVVDRMYCAVLLEDGVSETSHGSMVSTGINWYVEWALRCASPCRTRYASGPFTMKKEALRCK